MKAIKGLFGSSQKNNDASEKGNNKVLLLGSGESGKTTILKQLRLLHGTEWSDEDMRMYSVVVQSNVVEAMRKLCYLLQRLGLEGELNAAGRQAYDDLSRGTSKKATTGGKRDGSERAGCVANEDAAEFLANHEGMRALWQSDAMKKAWAERRTVNIIDAHKAFLNDMPRIAAPDYMPTPQDVLMARVRTTIVTMERYGIQGTDFDFYDTGGERSERKKWLKHFDGATAVIFVAAVAAYDQMLAEAKETNRVAEALELFRAVCNNEAFSNVPIVLFLNMKDVFGEKILHSDIAAQTPFCDYKGPAKDVDDGLLYFTQKFKECVTGDSTRVSIHVTCATDTNSMSTVLDSVCAMIKTDVSHTFS